MGNVREITWGRVQLDEYLEHEGDARKEWEVAGKERSRRSWVAF